MTSFLFSAGILLVICALIPLRSEAADAPQAAMNRAHSLLNCSLDEPNFGHLAALAKNWREFKSKFYETGTEAR